MNKRYPYRPYQPLPPTARASAAGIILLCILWTIFFPIPGFLGDLVVGAYGAYSAIRGLTAHE